MDHDGSFRIKTDTGRTIVIDGYQGSTQTIDTFNNPFTVGHIDHSYRIDEGGTKEFLAIRPSLESDESILIQTTGRIRVVDVDAKF